MATSNYTLTKQDLAAIRQADTICVSRNIRPGCPTSVEFVRKFPVTERNPYAHEETHTIDAPVRIAHESAQPDRDSLVCFSSISVYKNLTTEVGSILANLRVGDEIALTFHPDYHTNGHLARAGIHADCLVLTIYRPSKTLQFILDSQIVPDGGMFRMVRGARFPGWLLRDSDAA